MRIDRPKQSKKLIHSIFFSNRRHKKGFGLGPFFTSCKEATSVVKLGAVKLAKWTNENFNSTFQILHWLSFHENFLCQKRVLRLLVSDPCDPNPCGAGATCDSKTGNAICSCPKGRTGDPLLRCGKLSKSNK
jgi:hypothetical protein